jgi:hypothetical protein
VKAGAAVVSGLVVLVGAAFAGQGLCYIPGSVMTGDIRWFWIGGAMVVVGIALLAMTFFRRPRRA